MVPAIARLLSCLLIVIGCSSHRHILRFTFVFLDSFGAYLASDKNDNVTGNDDDDDDDDDDDGVDDVPARCYSAEEEAALYLGAQQYGVGRWADIRRTNDGLRNRLRVDLKDKWRTIVPQGRLEVLAGEFGPL